MNVYYLVARNTLDEVVWEKLKKKLEVVGEAVDGEGGVLSASAVEAETSPTEVKPNSFLSEIMDSLTGNLGPRKRRRDKEETQEEPKEVPRKRVRKREQPKAQNPEEFDEPGVADYQPPQPKDPSGDFVGSGYSSRRSVTRESPSSATRNEEQWEGGGEEGTDGQYYEENNNNYDEGWEEPYQERATTVPALPQGGDGKSKLDRFSFPKPKKK